jgi:hypothetical protein
LAAAGGEEAGSSITADADGRRAGGGGEAALLWTADGFGTAGGVDAATDASPDPGGVDAVEMLAPSVRWERVSPRTAAKTRPPDAPPTTSHIVRDRVRSGAKGDDADPLDSCVTTMSSAMRVGSLSVDAGLGWPAGPGPRMAESLSIVATRTLRADSVSFAASCTQSPTFEELASGMISSSARAMSRAVEKRLAASVSRPRMTTASSPGGRSLAYMLGGDVVPRSTRSSTCASFSPWKSRFPVSASHSTTDDA